MSELLSLTERLVAQVSLTPNDAGCQNILLEYLKPLGFETEWIYDGEDDLRVTNSWSIRKSILPN